MPDTLRGVGVTVVVDSITLDKRAYDKRVVIEGRDSTLVRTTYMPVDPGMNLSEGNVGEW